MGWFDEQVRERMLNDDEVFAEAFTGMAGSVLGERFAQALRDGRRPSRDSIDEILKYYHVPIREVPAKVKDLEDQLEYLLRPYGVMKRKVTLEKGWHREAIGAMLGMLKTGELVAFIPTGISGYTFINPETGRKTKVTNRNESMFEDEALAFYMPFPLKKLGLIDIIKYITKTLTGWDLVAILVPSVIVTLVSMLLPMLSNYLFGEVAENQNVRLLIAIVVFMVCASISSMLFNTVRSLAMSRISVKMDSAVEAATMMRMLSLPADFFSKYSSGELQEYSGNIGSLCNLLVDSLFTSVLSAVMSLAYFFQINIYSSELAGIAFLIILITFVVTVASTLLASRISKERLKLSAKTSGLTYGLITGVQKIRLSGAEKRAFAKWGRSFAQSAALTYNPPLFIKLNVVISTAISLLGSIMIYAGAIRSGISIADYYAFLTAFGLVSGAFSNLSGLALQIAEIKPILTVSRPILDAVPEIGETREVVSRLSGSIELSNVSFRYEEGLPTIIDNLSLKIKPGQYVAIVGKTGCGKSTLVRLLLGFERPQKGAIYYDGKDILKIDLKSLRKKIGVVLQNGKLFQGDIFSNITILSPKLTLDEAWEAAEMAGIADDIRRMPMGMNTIISEGEGGISGGQRQRLMIAAAIAPKPKILIFDEATSALDNITQKKVSESLDSLKCTRIVIAHRLSTIRHCDRIIVLDKGHIIEDGTYDELIEQKGFFAELVERQRLDTTN